MRKLCIGCCALAIVLALTAFPAVAAEGATGKVSINATRWNCTLMAGTRRLTIKGGTDPVQVPVGTYKVRSYQIFAKTTVEGKDGKPVEAEAMLYCAGGRSIEVKAGEVTALAFGPPLQAQVVTAQKAGKVTFSLRMTDAAGGRVVAVIGPKGKRMAPPKIDVVNDGGKIVYTATLAYG